MKASIPMYSKNLHSTWLLSISLLSASMLLNGCTPHDVGKVAELQTAVDELIQNRALCESMVRDIKMTVNHGDDGYAQAMDSYQHARQFYDSFLDTVESDGKSQVGRSMRGIGPTDIQNAAADFMADASIVLKYPVNTRRVRFQRLVLIPDDLRRLFRSLPKKDRERLFDRFDKEIRWHDWSEL